MRSTKRTYLRDLVDCTTEAIGDAQQSAGRQCQALLEDLEPATRKIARANEKVHQAVAEQDYDAVRDSGGPLEDAQTAYDDAFKNVLDSCEDI